MGASGAGKTTLLNVLAGRIAGGVITGDILVNGKKRGRDWKRIVGYVQQEDVFQETLTVEETIRFAATLKLPRTMDAREKEARVQRVIQSTGLGRVAQSYIGGPLLRGISGGELKRVSIGLELVSDHRVVFLDEPTSGLDAFTAFYIVELIKRVADGQS